MSKNKEYQIGAFANMLGVSIQTLRNWDESGKLKPSRVSRGGTRYYTQDKLEQYAREHGLSKDVEIKAILYLTVNSTDELTLLNDRVVRARELIQESNIPYDLTVVTDVFDLSNTDGFSKVLKQIANQQVNTLFIDQDLLSENSLMTTLFKTYTSDQSVKLHQLPLSSANKEVDTRECSPDVHQAFDQFLSKYQEQINDEVRQLFIKQLIEN